MTKSSSEISFRPAASARTVAPMPSDAPEPGQALAADYGYNAQHTSDW
jgi:hypothetical protein